jgi:subtilisin family serine protease
MRFLVPPRLLAGTLLALLLSPATARADAPVSEQIIVHHRAGLDAADRADVRQDSATELERRLTLPDTEVVAVTEGTRAQAIAELEADPDVAWAEPNVVVRAFTNDTYWHLLYGLLNNGGAGKRIDADIDAEQAWSATRGAGVTVAVVDSGVEAAHPDLAGRLVSGFDYVDGGAPADPHGHGTHVTGIVAANRGNGVGVAGIAPEASVMPLRVLDEYGEGNMAAVAQAFHDAGVAGVQVVNASLGAQGTSDSVLKLAVASHPNTLYVVAAGNSGLNVDATSFSPCDVPATNLLCVGATDTYDARASYSNYGSAGVDVFAPGSDIVSTLPGLTYDYKSGTSMASPYVAGVAALVASHTTLRGADIATRIKATVDKVPALAGRAVTGGRVNAARALGVATDAPSRPVFEVAQGGVNAATLQLASRESDIASYSVSTAAGAHLGTTTSRVVSISGLTAGSHSFVVTARNADGQDSPAAVATVDVSAPASPTPPTPTTPTTSTTSTTAPTTATTTTTPTPTTPRITNPVRGVQVVTRRGRRTLTFRVVRSGNVTVTLKRLQGGSYRRTASRTTRMAAGMQALPITSRLLGMRLARGRYQVTIGSGSAVTTVAFTRR